MTIRLMDRTEWFSKIRCLVTDTDEISSDASFGTCRTALLRGSGLPQRWERQGQCRDISDEHKQCQHACEER